MKKSSTFKFLAILFILTLSVAGQSSAQKWGEGNFTGSLESNSIYYFPDKKIDAPKLDDRFGSNNYMKLEYTNNRLTIGAQYEYYGKALQGYNENLNNAKAGKIMTKYITWTDKYYSITVGDIFEQFGNGMVLRTWEDRDLGFNNSIEGVRAMYNFNDYVTLKALWGRPRIAMTYASTDVRGADLSISLANIIGLNSSLLDIEGSFVNRNYKRDVYAKNQFEIGDNTDLYSARLNYEADFGLSFRGELAWKSKDVFETGLDAGRGWGQLVELGYTGNGFGVFLTGRRLKQMHTILNDESEYTRFPEANVLTYLPALTRQYTYSLANLQPYIPSPSGEQGGQFDMYYNFKRGTSLGGQYGTKLHINGSIFYPLGKNNQLKRYMSYADASIDIEKRWNRDFETTIMYAFQAYSPTKGSATKLYKYNIFVADMTYKFTRRMSLRLELQYLQSDDDYKDWWGVMGEFNFAPKWSIFGSTMYNWKDGNRAYNSAGEVSYTDKLHYYNAGFSFVHQRTRVQLSYARNRAGYVCSGGICRNVPAFKGINLLFTTSF